MQSDFRVLIIDGNPHDVRLAREVLESAGFGLDVRTDGSSAIEAFHAIQPDLVLIDARVPQTGGVHICQELRQTEMGRSTPILLMMDDTSPRASSAALKASGCAHVLQKPLVPHDLLEALSRFLPAAFLPGQTRSSQEWEVLGETALEGEDGFASPAGGQGPPDGLSFDEMDVGTFLDQIFSTKETAPPTGVSDQKSQRRQRPRASLRAGLEEEGGGAEALPDSRLEAGTERPVPSQGQSLRPENEDIGRSLPEAAAAVGASPMPVPESDIAAVGATPMSVPEPEFAAAVGASLAPVLEPDVAEAVVASRVPVPEPDVASPSLATAFDEAAELAKAHSMDTSKVPSPAETVALTPSMISALENTGASQGAQPPPGPLGTVTEGADQIAQELADNLNRNVLGKDGPEIGSGQRKSKKKSKLSRKERSRVQAAAAAAAESIPITASHASESFPITASHASESIAIAPPRVDESTPMAPSSTTVFEAQPLATEVGAGATSSGSSDVQAFHAISTSERPAPARRRGGLLLGGLALAVAACLVILYVIHSSGEGDLRPNGSPAADGEPPAPDATTSQNGLGTEDPSLLMSRERTIAQQLEALSPSGPMSRADQHPSSPFGQPDSGHAHAAAPATASFLPEAPGVRSLSGALGAARGSTGSSDPDSTAGPAPSSEKTPPEGSRGGGSVDRLPHARPGADSPEGPPRSRPPRPKIDRPGTGESSSATVSPSTLVQIATPDEPVAVEAEPKAGSSDPESDPITSPVPQRRQTPKYPPAAINLKQSGSVGLLVKVAPNGAVSEVRVARSVSPALDQAAVRAAYKWTYKPALKGSRPVTTWVEETIDFRIEQAEETAPR